MIAENYSGGPVGVDTIAAGLSEPRDAIEDIIEPFLIQKGFIQRTPRGRAHRMPSSTSASPSPRATQASSGCSPRTRTNRICDEPSRRRNPRRQAPSAGARLLRGHGFFRRRLSRQLSALHGARPHQLSASDRRRPSRTVRAGAKPRRRASALPWSRSMRHRFPAGRPAWTTCWTHRHRAGRGEGRVGRAAPEGHARGRACWWRRACRSPFVSGRAGRRPNPQAAAHRP